MDCRELEKLLWGNPEYYSEKDRLPHEMSEHIKNCPRCTSVYDEFLQLFTLSSKSELIKDDSYWNEFESVVWNKIQTADSNQESESAAVFKPRNSLSFGQLLASLTVAAGTVAMLMLAVSNITNEPDVSLMIHKAENRLLLSREQSTPKTMRKRYDLSFVQNEKGGLQFIEFSILSEPEVNTIGDSSEVRIDAAYLTDDGLDDKNVTVARASIQDVERGSGRAVSSIPHFETEMFETTPLEYIITVEKMPRMIKAVPPDYPPFAYKLKRGGDVWIKAYVDASGNVQQATVHRKSGSNYGFEEAALEAAYKNQFEPFEVDNKKMPVWVIYKVRFISKKSGY